jgi:hypothetical protein
MILAHEYIQIMATGAGEASAYVVGRYFHAVICQWSGKGGFE